jgi:hypothetical protein
MLTGRRRVTPSVPWKLTSSPTRSEPQNVCFVNGDCPEKQGIGLPSGLLLSRGWLGIFGTAEAYSGD